eukprot:3399252-Rhodomonas_salina.2
MPQGSERLDCPSAALATIESREAFEHSSSRENQQHIIVSDASKSPRVIRHQPAASNNYADPSSYSLGRGQGALLPPQTSSSSDVAEILSRFQTDSRFTPAIPSSHAPVLRSTPQRSAHLGPTSPSSPPHGSTFASSSASYI